MKRSISLKLALAFILTAVLTALLLTIVFLSTTSTSFEQFVFDQQFYTKLAEVTDYFANKQSWDGVENLLETSMGGMGGNGGMMGGQGMGQGGSGGIRRTQEASTTSQPVQIGNAGGRSYALADSDGRVVVGIEGLYDQGEALSPDLLATGVSITLDGQTVGTLFAQKRNIVYTQAEQLFLDRSKASLLLTLIITILVAALGGILLSRSLTRPVIELTAAAQNLAAGDLSQKVDVRSTDELGELSQAFNQMSAEIEQSDRQRKRMTADIAHDLRTPLTVIGGYIEAMRDGDLEPTTERLGMLYSEVTRLNRMVADLRMLSQSEAGALSLNLQTIEANKLLEETRELFELRAREQNVNLTVEPNEGLQMILGDETRLIQVMENLVGNALRHTPIGGQIRMSAMLDQSMKSGEKLCIRFSVSDSGEGISEKEIPYIFEEFHRVDKSRHTDENQSGLGLAIVKAIVLGHGGKVWVDSTLGQGSDFHFCIPVAS
ncbi:MAG: HAMP domain-containing protein [Chloroflexi bacterium]|nr:HAMP domain-containing protein [Chloroflexota bacterium]